jgi:chromosome segregation ATPase
MADGAEFGDSSAFEILEKDYIETLNELQADKAFEPFRIEYEKLHRALQKSHESEKRLIKKCRDLNSDITANATKVQIALKISQDDQQTIAALKREIEKATRLVEQSHEKEKQAKEIITTYKDEISELNATIDQGAGMSKTQEQAVNALLSQSEQLRKERDLMRQNAETMQAVSAETFAKVQKIEEEKMASEVAISDVKQKLADKKAEVEAEKRRKEKLEKQMKELRLFNEHAAEELEEKKRQGVEQENNLKKVDTEIKNTEREEQRLEVELKKKMDEKKSYELKLDQETVKNNKMIEENSEKAQQLRLKREDIERLRAERDKVVKLHDMLKRKEKSLEEERKELEGNRNGIKQDIKQMQEKFDSMSRDADSDKKKIEDLLRERDILNKNVIKADERTKKQIDLVKRQETQALNLQKDIARWKQDAQEFKKRIFELEKQREKYGIELSQANSKYFNALEELKRRDERLTELKKQIADVRAKLNQQKNLYDAVCTDRNLYSKNLIESNEEITEMKRKFKIMYHQIEQLKEEIKDKDSALIKEHFEHHKVQKANEDIKEKLSNAQKRMKNLTNIVETQRAEIKKLESTIQEAEQEKQSQQKEYEGVISERDILGTQLIRRNEELALLYEKIKIQQSTLQKGEIQFKERVDEIAAFKNNIRKLKRELHVARNQVVNIEALKKEIHHLNKELLQEQSKCKALQEELENPMNVHRWRKLEGSDPATYEMIQKVKMLQKRLIAKTEEVVEKDMQIQEKEKLYVQLKNILARQPGPEVAEQLAWYSQNLKEKTKQMQQMASELKSYHGQVKDLKDEIERYHKELDTIKQAYFNQKRQDHMNMQQDQMEEGGE